MKNTVNFSIKIPHLTFTVHYLLSDHLLYWKDPILASYPFLSLLRTTYKRKALLRAIHPKVCSKVAQKLPPKFKKVAYFWESFCSRLLLKTWRCICNLTSFVVINIIFKLNITNNRKYFLMTFPMSKHHNVCYRHHSADDQQLLYYNCPMWKCVTVGCPPC